MRTVTPSWQVVASTQVDAHLSREYQRMSRLAVVSMIASAVLLWAVFAVGQGASQIVYFGLFMFAVTAAPLTSWRLNRFRKALRLLRRGGISLENGTHLCIERGAESEHIWCSPAELTEMRRLQLPAAAIRSEKAT